ncbi:AraC family ligand binding domain-containing protein [Pseudonocardia endophytica]|uniref:Gentisate 1,2-dioxygenase n=1 Tax=Pseudonocardia endophytica TaxID=401976 RepID=A0A4R1HG47_PSEEN|nr:AraC family ligand binding domain-containing protein [Pseudonocardia endophytica]TCK21134.1 gentisate 1,2-dioxygenase [Pseudonocardia endophytica]
MSITDTRTAARMVDLSGDPASRPQPWAPIKVTRAEIEAEIDRLASAPRPANGRRVGRIVHPSATAPGLGFAPGISVAIEVLNPCEQADPLRENAHRVEIGIAGSGRIDTGDGEIALAHLDVANLPSMKPFRFRNDGPDVWARLSYSNAALLEQLGVHYAEDVDRVWSSTPVSEQDDQYTRVTAPDIAIGDSGARLRGYEHLVDIEVVDSRALHWPWAEVSPHLSQTLGDGRRTIMALYNPASQRRQGATHNFFVTATSMPPGRPPRPRGPGHRHSSAAINYHVRGTGFSTVDGQDISWEAGDLLLSAPGWLEHAHYEGPDGIAVYTVQDHPLHIGMESLVWQEKMDGPVLALGSEAGQTGYVGPREAGA